MPWPFQDGDIRSGAVGAYVWDYLPNTAYERSMLIGIIALMLTKLVETIFGITSVSAAAIVGLVGGAVIGYDYAQYWQLSVWLWLPMIVACAFICACLLMGYVGRGRQPK